MKVSVWVAVDNQGDGSTYVRVFSSESEADNYEQARDEKYNEGWAEPSVQELELEFDESGNLLNGEPPFDPDN